jgi:hypothetical protein
MIMPVGGVPEADSLLPEASQDLVSTKGGSYVIGRKVRWWIRC